MRVAVFVDGFYFYCIQKDKLGWWVDPKRLLDHLSEYGELVDAFYYSGITNNENTEPQKSFFKALTYIGYSLFTKELKSNDSDKRYCNLEVEIVLDMMKLINNYDLAVLVGGSCDYTRVTNTLRILGKRVLVYSSHGYISQELRAAIGNHFVDFVGVRKKIEKIKSEGEPSDVVK